MVQGIEPFPVRLDGVHQFTGAYLLLFENQLPDYGQAVGHGAHTDSLGSSKVIARSAGIDVAALFGASFNQQGQVGQRLHFPVYVVHDIRAAGVYLDPVSHLLFVGFLQLSE